MTALRGKTIKQCSLEHLFSGEVVDDQAWQKLQALLRTRIDARLAGEASAKSVRGILDEELTAGIVSPDVV